MNKEIQEIILWSIKKDSGTTEWRDVKNSVQAEYFTLEKSIPSTAYVKHQLDLLIDQGKVQEESGYYKILTWGHYQLMPWWKRWGYFLIHKKHNLVSFLALLVSIAAFIISMM